MLWFTVCFETRLVFLLSICPQTKRMDCDRVNGVEEADFCKKGESGVCCEASSEVLQVSHLQTQHRKLDFISALLLRYLTHKYLLQLRETVSQQKIRIQMLEKQVTHFTPGP